MNTRLKTPAAKPLQQDNTDLFLGTELLKKRSAQLDFLSRLTGSLFSRDPSADGQSEIVSLGTTLANMAQVIEKLAAGAEREELLKLHQAATYLASDIEQAIKEAQLAVSESGSGLACIAEMLDKLEEERIDTGNLCALISPLARQVNQSNSILRGML